MHVGNASGVARARCGAALACCRSAPVNDVAVGGAALGHLLVLGLLGVILADISLHDFRKIPFTCSYLPGRSNIHITFILSVLFMLEITDIAALLELPVLENFTYYVLTLIALVVAALLARWRASPAAWERSTVEFDEVPPWSLISLGLPRDGGRHG